MALLPNGPIAYLIPTTEDTITAVNLKNNRIWRQYTTQSHELTGHHPSDTIALMYAMLYGCTALTFGASIHSDFVLPGNDIPARLFDLRLDTRTGRVMLTNASDADISIQTDHAKSLLRAEDGAIAIHNTCHMAFGFDSRYAFSIDVANLSRHCFAHYLRTIEYTATTPPRKRSFPSVQQDDGPEVKRRRHANPFSPSPDAP